MEVEEKLYLSRIFDNIISRPTYTIRNIYTLYCIPTTYTFNIYEILALVLIFSRNGGYETRFKHTQFLERYQRQTQTTHIHLVCASFP